MMIVDFVSFVGRCMAVASICIALVLLTRETVRRTFGAAVGYASWLLVPICATAVCLPARTVVVQVSASEGRAVTAPVAIAPALSIPSPGSSLSTDAGPDLLVLAVALVALWGAGVVVQLVRLVVGHRRLLASLALTRRGDIYQAHRSDIGPAVVGVLRPRIVVPADFAQRYSEQERTLVLAHERAHIDAGDLYVNAAAALALCVNWFNPLFYAARRALRIDQELACDERVMRRFGHARRAYGHLLLKAQLAATEPSFVCQWPASGHAGLKGRLTMLAAPPPASAVRHLGFAMSAVLFFATAATAWASQPPTTAYVDASKTSTASLRPLTRASRRGRALVEAIGAGNDERAGWLIANGADVDYVMPADGTPLIVAVQRRNHEMVTRLLEAGADVDHPAKGDGSPLIVAAQVGDMKLVRALVAAGADVNGHVPGDETPLINAARLNRLDVARFLIARGADVNLEVDAPTLSGLIRRSPMSVARKNGHREMLRLLRGHGAQRR